ncbi:MAG: DUF3487 family protein [Gammaproteobacteria bacterium]|nr:DUF3487 family protein [Gammaproteobacteria bacterium]
MTRPASPLGFEPPMFRGLSGTELTATIGLSMIPGMVGAGLLCLWAGSLLWVLPVLVLNAFATVLLAGTVLRHLKRNRPPNWYLQRLARHFGRQANIIWWEGPWRMER